MKSLDEWSDEELVAKFLELDDTQKTEHQKLVGLSRKEFYARDRDAFWNAHNDLVLVCNELRKRGIKGIDGYPLVP